VLFADPAIPGDEIEAQLAQIAGFELPELGADEVVVEDVDPTSLPGL
jgi:hypothetical protein